MYNVTLQPNTMVGQRYRIVRFIARGGMAEVYEAYDEDLHERVALKIVTAEGEATASEPGKASATERMSAKPKPWPPWLAGPEWNGPKPRDVASP